MPAYWTTLEHNGVNFPPLYQPAGTRLRVRGKDVPLTPIGEEMVYNLAKKKDTPYVSDPVFLQNFMSDFMAQLPPWCKGAKFEELDLSSFYARVDQEKRAKEAMSKEARKAQAAERKTTREALKERYGYALLDGKRVEFANYMVEPPGLFMGRGQHPFRGRWKPRVFPKDVVLNLGEGAPVPSSDWKEVVHDHRSMWMAKWVDKLTDKEKYVWLHESTPIQQSRSKAKYDKAEKVGRSLEKVRSRIDRALTSSRLEERQVATVCYLIDRLGMRVGDEKEEDEADTVGASTLRVEHLKFEGEKVLFDFLGKDSVRWEKELAPEPPVLKNLQRFTSKKAPEDEVFHHVGSSDVNKFLSSIVPGLSAKVFRTYHATEVTRTALGTKDVSSYDDNGKLYHAKEANLSAAVFCNHQRTPPKTWDQSFEKKRLKLEEARSRPKPDLERIRRLELELDFYRRTKNYNLNTSLKNYIDPRVYKSWGDYVGFDWQKIYPKSMQRKFSWVAVSKKEWKPAGPEC